MKKVIVTGALGFIGYHLCQKLLDEGIEVTAIDHLPTCKDQKLAEFKLDSFGRNSLFHFLNKRVEELDFGPLTKEAEVLFHLAADTKEDKWEEVEKKISQNVRGTKHLAQGCRKGIRVIFASTTQVYGNRIGIIEESAPTNPANYYALTKLTAEKMLMEESRKRNFDLVIFRLPIIYGPWQREDLAYHQLIKARVLREPSVPSIRDRSTTDVLYISDVIAAFFQAATMSGDVNECFHLGSGKHDEWWNGIEYITEIKGSRKKNPLLDSIISIKKAQERLGFIPSVSLKEGLRLQEKAYREWLRVSKDLT